MYPSRISLSRLLPLVAVILVALGTGIWLLVPHRPPAPANHNHLATTTYVGTNNLLALGATTDVINDFEFAMHQFLTQHPPIVQHVAISNVVHHHDLNTGNESYDFTVSLEATTYHATLSTTSLTAAQLTLTEGGTPVFTSPTIDVSSQP